MVSGSSGASSALVRVGVAGGRDRHSSMVSRWPSVAPLHFRWLLHGSCLLLCFWRWWPSHRSIVSRRRSVFFSSDWLRSLVSSSISNLSIDSRWSELGGDLRESLVVLGQQFVRAHVPVSFGSLVLGDSVAWFSLQV